MQDINDGDNEDNRRQLVFSKGLFDVIPVVVFYFLQQQSQLIQPLTTLIKLFDVVFVVVFYFLQQQRQLIQLLTTLIKLLDVVFVVVFFLKDSRSRESSAEEAAG